MATPTDTLFTNLKAARMTGDSPYGLLESAAIGVADGRITWIGPTDEAPSGLQTVDLGGRLVTPALIDCHTHIVFGGNRAREFELRLEGASYEEISRAGGGIVSTVGHTRAASEDDLLESALPRVDQLIAEGVGTIEIKSGYGLDIETEIKMLRAARRVGEKRNIRIRTSFLGAHATPAEFKGRDDDYIDFVCDQALPAAHIAGVVDAVDGFCEGIAFSPEQMARVFDKAAELAIPIKLHAEQLSDLGGAAMATHRGALSVDHLEYLNPKDVSVLADHGTVAVLLPGAFYTLRETQLPPVQALREAGVPIAIATDCNPGSSPLTSILLTINMACTLFRLTPEEALRGCTKHAAAALGLAADLGTLEIGKIADLAVWNVSEPAELAYRIGFNPLYQRIIGGQA